MRPVDRDTQSLILAESEHMALSLGWRHQQRGGRELTFHVAQVKTKHFLHLPPECIEIVALRFESAAVDPHAGGQFQPSLRLVTACEMSRLGTPQPQKGNARSPFEHAAAQACVVAAAPSVRTLAPSPRTVSESGLYSEWIFRSL